MYVAGFTLPVREPGIRHELISAPNLQQIKKHAQHIDRRNKDKARGLEQTTTIDHAKMAAASPRNQLSLPLFRFRPKFNRFSSLRRGAPSLTEMERERGNRMVSGARYKYIVLLSSIPLANWSRRPPPSPYTSTMKSHPSSGTMSKPPSSAFALSEALTPLAALDESRVSRFT